MTTLATVTIPFARCRHVEPERPYKLSRLPAHLIHLHNYMTAEDEGSFHPSEEKVRVGHGNPVAPVVTNRSVIGLRAEGSPLKPTTGIAKLGGPAVPAVWMSTRGTLTG